eukprot:scaffold419215_cov34-Prasinocladus_malaysianus.AAC.2
MGNQKQKIEDLKSVAKRLQKLAKESNHGILRTREEIVSEIERLVGVKEPCGQPQLDKRRLRLVAEKLEVLTRDEAGDWTNTGIWERILANVRSSDLPESEGGSTQGERKE